MNYQAELTRIRRHLHQYPEIGFDTVKTLDYIRLESGCEPLQLTRNSAIIQLGTGDIKLAFRYEMDALPIEEKNQCEYKSVNHFMHACGHDGHMAIGLVLIKLLKKQVFDGSVLFIFQNGEESGAGAKLLLEKMNFEIPRMFALHLLPNLAKHHIASRVGAIMANSCEFRIETFGISAHAGLKALGKDALSELVDIYKQIYTFKSELPFVLHIGKMNGGKVMNQVADYACMEGTLRCYDENLFSELLMHIQKEGKTTLGTPYHSVVNDSVLFEEFRQLIPIDSIEPLFLSDDFGYFSHVYPGLYFFLGIGETSSLHSAIFDFDEEVLLTGLKVCVSLVNKYGIQCEMK